MVALSGAGLGLVACQSPTEDAASSRQAAIRQAEAKSHRGANPNWLQLTHKGDLFKRVRDRAYGYCLSGANIDEKCASEQDDAVEAAVLAIYLAAAQAEMKDKDKLGLKERYVATNPDVAPRVENACWALYKEHGAADARILSVCLGNLTDFSPLIPLPVP